MYCVCGIDETSWPRHSGFDVEMNRIVAYDNFDVNTLMNGTRRWRSDSSDDEESIARQFGADMW